MKGWGLPLLLFLISIFYLQGRPELACGEIFQRAEARVEFLRRQAALTVERAQKIADRTVGFARVAFNTAGNHVAVGIAAEAYAGHDVVETLQFTGSVAKAVKASAAFAIVNGFAERQGFPEIFGFERRGRRRSRSPHYPSARLRDEWRAISAPAERADILGRPHLHGMTVLVPSKHAQRPQLVEPAHRIARRSDAHMQSTTHRRNRKLYARLADDEGMAQQITIDGALLDRQAETWRENIFKFYPEDLGIQFFAWH